MPATKLVAIGIVFLLRGALPNAVSSETGLEALHADNGEEQPEEANQKGYVDEDGSGFLQAAEDDLEVGALVQKSERCC